MIKPDPVVTINRVNQFPDGAQRQQISVKCSGEETINELIEKLFHRETRLNDKQVRHDYDILSSIVLKIALPLDLKDEDLIEEKPVIITANKKLKIH